MKNNEIVQSSVLVKTIIGDKPVSDIRKKDRILTDKGYVSVLCVCKKKTK